MTAIRNLSRAGEIRRQKLVPEIVGHELVVAREVGGNGGRADLWLLCEGEPRQVESGRPALDLLMERVRLFRG